MTAIVPAATDVGNPTLNITVFALFVLVSTVEAATCAPVKDGLRKNASGSIGSDERRSIARNAPSSAVAPANAARLPKPPFRRPPS